MDQRRTWEVNNIQLKHVISTFDSLSHFSASNESELVRLHFGLKGDYEFTYQQLNRSFNLAGGHHNVMYSNGLDLEVCNKTLEIETFGVDFPKELFIGFTSDSDGLLDKFTEGILQGKGMILSEKWGSISPKIQQVIDEILLNPYSGDIQRVFLLAKSLELLVLCLDNYQKSQNIPVLYIKSRLDKEKVIAARDYINERVSSPPGLSEIARSVGLNEFKLKNGFKEIFHSTVFGYIAERRLSLAKQYLLDTEKTAAEVSMELGYSSPQHFSHAFKKKFGIPPKGFQNQSAG